MTTKKEDKDNVLKDGERLVVSLHMMDGAQRQVAARELVTSVLHRPAFVIDHRRHGPGERLEREAAAAAENERKAAARAKYQATVQNAWKDGPPTPLRETQEDAPELAAAHDAALNSINLTKRITGNAAPLGKTESKTAVYQHRDAALENAWRNP